MYHLSPDLKKKMKGKYLYVPVFIYLGLIHIIFRKEQNDESEPVPDMNMSLFEIEQKTTDKHTEYDNDAWICQRCTFINQKAMTLCEICGGKKENNDKDTDSDGWLWLCPKPDSSKKHTVKSTKSVIPIDPKPSTIADANPMNQEPPKSSTTEDSNNAWSCSKCTFINEKSRSVCEICGAGNQHADKDIKSLEFINVGVPLM